MHWVISIKLGQQLYLACQDAAKRDGRSLAGWIRHTLSKAIEE